MSEDERELPRLKRAQRSDQHSTTSSQSSFDLPSLIGSVLPSTDNNDTTTASTSTTHRTPAISRQLRDMDQSVEISQVPIQRFPLGLTRSNRNSVAYNKASEVVVTCHVYLRSRATLCLGCSDGSLHIWRPRNDMRTSDIHRITCHPGHKGRIFATIIVKELATQGLLITASADRTIKLWDIWDRELKQRCVQTIVGHGGSVTSLCYVSGYLISCSTDHTVRIWRSTSHPTSSQHRSEAHTLLLYPWFEQIQVITQSHGLKMCPMIVSSFHTADHITIFVGDAKGRVQSFAPQRINHTSLYQSSQHNHHHESTFELIRTHKIHTLSISHMYVVVQETLIITLSYDHTVQVHDALSPNGYFAIENPARCRYTAVTWDLHHQQLFLGDEHGHLQIWNIYTDRCLKSMQLLQQPIVGLSLHSPSRLMVLHSDGCDEYTIERNIRFSEFKGHDGPILAMCHVGNMYGKEQPHVYSAAMDSSIRCWDSYDMSCLSILHSRSCEISCMTYIPGSIMVVTGHDDGSIQMWNIDSGTSISLQHHTNTVSCLCVAKTPRTDCLISGSFDTTISVWDVTKRRAFNPVPEYAMIVSDEEVLCIAYHPTTLTIFTAGNDCKIHLWHILRRQLRGCLKGHTAPVNTLAIDGNFVISGSDDQQIRLWDILTMSCIMTLSGHTHSIRHIIVIPIHGYIVSCASDGHIIIWDYTNVDEPIVKRLIHADKKFRCLLYDPWGKRLYAGTEENKILILHLPDDMILEKSQEQDVIGRYQEIVKEMNQQTKEIKERDELMLEVPLVQAQTTDDDDDKETDQPESHHVTRKDSHPRYESKMKDLYPTETTFTLPRPTKVPLRPLMKLNER